MHLPRKKYLFLVLLVVSCLASSVSTYSQQFYRFRADVSIKDKLADGSYRLTMGKVYYDKVYKKIVYDLNFPKRETMVMQDTMLYVVQNGKLANSSSTMLIPEFTVFHLALAGKLANYGLESGEGTKIYKIGKVEKTPKGILTTWVPAAEQFKKAFGNIQMLKVGKRLDAMIFYDPKGKMLSRQFFKDYVNVKGVEFPQQVTMMNYPANGKETIQQTTYKNIVIDENDKDNFYRYKVPVNKLVRKN